MTFTLFITLNQLCSHLLSDKQTTNEMLTLNTGQYRSAQNTYDTTDTF